MTTPVETLQNILCIPSCSGEEAKMQQYITAFLENAGMRPFFTG